ncbi:hypothetical protein H9P43_007116 [Blastocladiella emersonii ATCC 22665]|nr:hypothetical protein H9P43_007116 [Blastocladiella emersonii ATCC 22665]
MNDPDLIESWRTRPWDPKAFDPTVPYFGVNGVLIAQMLCGLWIDVTAIFQAVVVMLLVLASLERYMFLIRLQPLRERFLYGGVAQTYLVGVLNYLFHKYNDSHPILSTGNFYCYPTTILTWVAWFDMSILVGNIGAMMTVYALVLRTVRESHKQLKQQDSFRKLGASGALPLGAAKTASVPQTSMDSVRPLQKAPSTALLPPANGMLRTASGAAGSGILAGGLAAGFSETSSGSGHGTPANAGAATVVAKDARSRRKSLRQAQLEYRIIMRGIMALAGFGCAIAFMVLFIRAMLTGTRSSWQFDMVFNLVKFTTEMVDPLIIVAVDKRFRAAVYETFVAPVLTMFPGTRSASPSQTNLKRAADSSLGSASIGEDSSGCGSSSR